METERLRFRPYIQSDAEFYVALVADPRVMQYIGDGTTRSREVALGRLESLIARYDAQAKTGLMVLERKSDGRAIGHAGLVPQTVDGVNELEIGYWIAPEFWGEGYATEAAATLRDHGLRTLGRLRLISIIQPANTASMAVAQKIGMTYERDVLFGEKGVRIFSIATSCTSPSS
jgi:RimJ/RimL family protein N-acetyltransferase